MHRSRSSYLHLLYSWDYRHTLPYLTLRNPRGPGYSSVVATEHTHSRPWVPPSALQNPTPKVLI
jgi:hypothetical protein